MNKREFVFALLISLIITQALFNKAHAAVVPLDFSGGWQVNSDTGSGRTINLTSTGTGSAVFSNTSPPKVNMPSMSLNVPTTKGVKSVLLTDVSQTVAASRIASSAGKLLKTLPYVGTAIAVADLFCEVTTVCRNTANTGYDKVSTLAPTTPIYTATSITTVTGTFTTPLAACQAYMTKNYPASTASINSNYPWMCKRDGSNWQSINGGVPSCQSGYTYQSSNNTCTTTQTQRTPATDSDWDTAYAYYDSQAKSLSAMNTMAHFVIDNKAPIPVDDPDFTPKVFTMPFEGTTIRDGQGIATGSSETSTTVTVSPCADKYKACSVESSTTTTKDPSGNVTGSTTKVESNPTGTPVGEEKPEPVNVDIDNVPDVDLPTAEINPTLSTTSFGSGSCPSDPTVSTHLGSFTLPFHVACGFASAVRPIVTLIALLTAALIISGVKLE